MVRRRRRVRREPPRSRRLRKITSRRRTRRRETNLQARQQRTLKKVRRKRKRRRRRKKQSRRQVMMQSQRRRRKRRRMQTNNPLPQRKMKERSHQGRSEVRSVKLLQVKYCANLHYYINRSIINQKVPPDYFCFNLSLIDFYFAGCSSVSSSNPIELTYFF